MIVRSDMSAFNAKFAGLYAVTAEGKPGIRLVGAVAKGIDPANVTPLAPGDAERMAASRALAKTPTPLGAMIYGYRAQLYAHGGQAEVDSFHANLAAYLKTTKLCAPSLDAPAPGASSDAKV